MPKAVDVEPEAVGADDVPEAGEEAEGEGAEEGDAANEIVTASADEEAEDDITVVSA